MSTSLSEMSVQLPLSFHMGSEEYKLHKIRINEPKEIIKISLVKKDSNQDTIDLSVGELLEFFENYRDFSIYYTFKTDFIDFTIENIEYEEKDGVVDIHPDSNNNDTNHYD